MAVAWPLHDATLMAQTAPEEVRVYATAASPPSVASRRQAYRKFDDLSKKHIANLRALTKNIQDARLQRDQELIRRWLKQYDEALEKYIPVLMSQARIYWDLEHYPMVEKIFRQSAEFCSEHEVWVLNVAHVFFLQARRRRHRHRHPPPPPATATATATRTATRTAAAPSRPAAAPRCCRAHRRPIFCLRRKPSSGRPSVTTSRP